jgi:hypothetical protein
MDCTASVSHKDLVPMFYITHGVIHTQIAAVGIVNQKSKEGEVSRICGSNQAGFNLTVHNAHTKRLSGIKTPAVATMCEPQNDSND